MTFTKILAHGVAAMILATALAIPLAGAPGVGAHQAADATNEVDGPNILVNGGFERGADPGVSLILPAGSPVLQGWTVETPGAERQIYCVGTLWQAEEGTRSLGFRLSQFFFTQKKQVPDIKQTFPTTAGQQYRVIFYQAVDALHRNNPMILRMMVAGQSRDYTYQADQGATRQHMEWVRRTFVFVAMAASTTIQFSPRLTTFDDGPLLGLDNVQVRAIQASASQGQGTGSSATQPGAAAATLTIASPTLPAGGQQTITVTTDKGAAVALVIAYPDGSQVVMPVHAGSDGRYAYSFAVPAAIRGTVKIIVVAGAGAIAQGSFTVN